ncbi:hypothetical protein LSAT2_032556, partial [Lamellibrachia satsuma]
MVVAMVVAVATVAAVAAVAEVVAVAVAVVTMAVVAVVAVVAVMASLVTVDLSPTHSCPLRGISATRPSHGDRNKFAQPSNVMINGEQAERKPDGDRRATCLRAVAVSGMCNSSKVRLHCTDEETSCTRTSQ